MTTPPVCDFGWQAPDFTLSDPDGQAVSLRAQLGDKGLLIAFICNHCPYVQRIADRLTSDAQALIGDGINVIAIMSNDYETYTADAPDKMTAFAERHRFPFPYLVDHDQSVARAYGAACTPDFFGLNAKGDLQYRGRLDELVPAMRQIADTGEGPREQIPSMGCSIKWRSA